eukprot:6878669-Prymnesium_polylepis.1
MSLLSPPQDKFQTDEDIFEVNNGCICCTVRVDLITILDKLSKRHNVRLAKSPAASDFAAPSTRAGCAEARRSRAFASHRLPRGRLSGPGQLAQD